MEKKRTLVRALGGVLIGGLLLSGGMAFAVSENNSASGSIIGKLPFLGQGGKHLGGKGKGGHLRFGSPEQKQQLIADSLKALVEKGNITQEQSDKIRKQFADAEKERQEFLAKMEDMTLREIRQYKQDNGQQLQNPIAKLVSDGVITQHQADAFHQAMRETAQKQNQQRITDGLKALVDKGTITQGQSDEILKKLEQVRNDRQALIEKMQDMTKEEIRQYVKDNKEKAQNPLSQLVSEGTITQDQADAVAKILFQSKGFKGGHKGFKGGRF